MSRRNLSITIPHPGFRSVPRTGVIFVMTEASKRGYSPLDPNWINLGQGAPETGPLPNSLPRITQFEVHSEDHEYAPIDGLPELREAVAELYNARYRGGKKSKYTKDNVAISSGGRTGLTRVISTIGRTNIGHFLPDYTAYEELLDSFESFVSIPILLEAENKYKFTSEDLREEILGRGLSAILLSNPSNPTGKVVAGEELKNWVDVAREVGCTLIFDEFYSHYIYGEELSYVSAAEYVNDVNQDGIIIVDGLTKNWRYPGWRVSWTVGPRDIIEGLASAGSFLDGGSSRPIQRAVIKLVEREYADKEAAAIQETFGKKKELLLKILKSAGIKISPEPTGGFYCWGDLSALTEDVNTGMKFFERALEEKLIVVPGEFFDINPGSRRPDRPSRFRSHVRFSFGPSSDSIEKAQKKLERVVKN